MTDDDLEVVRSGGNLFRDLGRPGADLQHLKARLAARLIGVLDERGLAVRDAESLTGHAAEAFSQVREVRLEAFSVERLLAMLDGLGEEVELAVSFHHRAAPPQAA